MLSIFNSRRILHVEWWIEDVVCVCLSASCVSLCQKNLKGGEGKTWTTHHDVPLLELLTIVSFDLSELVQSLEIMKGRKTKSIRLLQPRFS